MAELTLAERTTIQAVVDGMQARTRRRRKAARQGWDDLVMLMANISLNLGIFNLLPIPILDGGSILMLLFESVIRRDVSLAFGFAAQPIPIRIEQNREPIIPSEGLPIGAHLTQGIKLIQGGR